VKNKTIGLGTLQAKLYFYIKNRPPLSHYQNLSTMKIMTQGEINRIGNETGNHWRKIFNVYAKLMFELDPEHFTCWQALRDEQLLQKDDHCLLFSPPEIVMNNEPNKECKIHIVLGKGYAEKLELADKCTWLSHDFAVNVEKKIIICPYFDYRQLSNIKIAQLCRLIQQLSEPNTTVTGHRVDASTEWLNARDIL
jgi:hypothetical protein